ncbi:MAG: alkaline phosphatase family protein [Thermoplasmata archaeon]|nr:alkaline phosphatase family protein [Thermoplasmata archaeon]
MSKGRIDPLNLEAEGLTLPSTPGGIPNPSYGGRSIANIAASLLRAHGVTPGRRPILPALAASLDPFRGRPAQGTTVVFLVDGLGWLGYPDWVGAGGSSIPDGWRSGRPLTTVFPSTTAAALASLSTGTAPGAHGIVGYHQFLPRFGVVANMLRMSPVGEDRPESLVGPKFRPSMICGSPTLFRRGLGGTALSHRAFEGTGFTRAIYDGAEYVSHLTAADLALCLGEILERPRPPPVVFAYWSELDSGLHRRGTSVELLRLEMDRLADLLRYVSGHLAPRLRERTTLLVTGDHGMVPCRPSSQIDISREPTILRELDRPLAGDRRAGFFRAKRGRGSALLKALERRLPPGARVIATEEALGWGLFGPAPFHPELRERIGDMIVLVRSPSGLTQSPRRRAHRHREPEGAHGGLEAGELLVPLISGRFSEFG